MGSGICILAPALFVACADAAAKCDAQWAMKTMASCARKDAGAFDNKEGDEELPIDFHSDIHTRSLVHLQTHYPDPQAVGKHRREPFNESTIWRFARQTIEAAAELADACLPESCGFWPLAERQRFNASLSKASAEAERALGPKELRRAVALGMSLRTVQRQLGHDLMDISAAFSARPGLGSSVDGCGRNYSEALHVFQRTAHIRIGQLHSSSLHLADLLQGVPSLIPPKVLFHRTLGTGRQAVQRELLRIVQGSLDRGELLHMAEVGVDDAKKAAALLATMPSLQYLGVDPYPPCEVEDPSCWPPPEERYATALLRLMAFPGRAHLMRSESTAAARWIKDGSLDLVWVDAFHTYENTAQDLRDWLPKLRKGGFIAGHDYSAAFPGVVDAVHEVYADFPSVDGTLHLAPDYTYFWRPRL
eukprot:TRINITY_DN63147_c0_g1_i1.p1 TRINITY_DN63147_c0_g1~~TRINITY_DN63147_c0_g1_i1.p1  ORF type:complete len:428 (-),score=88.71 TRINITY_DN63147_c0_g1_i1:40-1296(-)